jgi:hypothetical protein
MLLIVGDGIAEGTRRIGEYLLAQPGLAFDFGLIEMAEYRHHDGAGTERVVIHPRVLAQTTTIDRHVIRSEVPGLVIEPVSDELPRQSARAANDTSDTWRAFVERLAAETSFDDPGQPAPRSGGLGWAKLALPGPFYVNLYRSRSSALIGAQLRLPGNEGATAFDALAADRVEIDKEFTEHGMQPPQWETAEVPTISLTTSSPLPWDEATEATQRDWMASTANQFVNSFRPRLQRLGL